MHLEEILLEKLGEHTPENVEELVIDGLINEPFLTEENKKVLEHYNNLVHLSMNELGLTQLINFPKLPHLQILELKKNKLKGHDLHLITELYPKLYKLKLTNNMIDNINLLKPINNSNIEKIEIIGNPFIKTKKYRSEVFDLLHNIVIVDGEIKTGQDIDTTDYDEEDEEEGESSELYSQSYDRDEGEDDEDEDDFDEYQYGRKHSSKHKAY